jgi:hypothetical protein
MKRILWASVPFLFALASCSTSKPSPETAPPRQPASSGPAEYGGQSGNFTYQYHGTLGELDATLVDTKFHIPVGSTKDFGFLTKLSAERWDLLHENLFDTGVDDGDADCATIMKVPHRTADGRCYYYNQKVFADKVRIGDNQQRFGRNVPATSAVAKYDVMDPNPRVVSQKLLTRIGGKTREADIINVLAAAWLQAQNHDWFTHGKNAKPEQAAMLHMEAVPGDREFPNGINVPATQPDQSGLDPHGYAKTFRNHVTHWWDASEIYGSDEATIQKVRTNPETHQLIPGGKLAVHPDRHLYYDAEGLPITGFNDNWWIGLDLIHTLFAMEHNYVCDQLKARYPKMTDEEIFQKARMIVAALIAKIHTVEWTPALLDNKVLHIGMYSNWYGLKSAVGVQNLFLRKILGDLNPRMRHAVSGLVGTGLLAPYNVPFTLTEEFVSVYRMHPLVPESITPVQPDGTPAADPVPVENAIFRKVPGLLQGKDASLNWMYGFGTQHPGGLLLHNHPSFMQRLTAERNTGASSAPENSVRMDLAALDVLRDRERLVPRYNEFRRALRLKPIAKFEDLTDDADDVAALKDVYGGDVEKLDLLVGTLAEKDRYAGFAFGNTPFYIFALMASRRLMADPFFSEYFTPDVYTPFGYDWVQKQTMVDVITRHFPELKPRFKGVTNAFKPWQPEFDRVKAKYDPQPSN